MKDFSRRVCLGGVVYKLKIIAVERSPLCARINFVEFKSYFLNKNGIISTLCPV